MKAVKKKIVTHYEVDLSDDEFNNIVVSTGNTPAPEKGHAYPIDEWRKFSKKVLSSIDEKRCIYSSDWDMFTFKYSVIEKL